MNDDVSAVVLAAGEGRRLDPLTNRRPKPMVPVANRPLLEYVIEAIAAAGIERIVLVVGYRQERIRNHFGDGDDWGVEIEYVVQEKQLGTGHAVLQAEDAVDGDFLVLNGDRIVDASLIEDVRDELGDGDGPVISVTRSRRSSAYGVVELEGNTLERIIEKPITPVASELINAGVYGFDEGIFERVRETPTDAGELAITTTLNDLTDDRSVRVVRYQGTWLDVSFLWDILTVNAAVVGDCGREGVPETAAVADDVAIGDDVQIGANATIRGSTSIGANATIEPNAVLSNAVVLPDAVVESGAVVRDAVVAENARVGANATIVGGAATLVVDGEVYEDVDFGGVVGDNATLGGGVTVEPGTVVGDGTTVAHGVSLGGRIESDAIVRRG